jgi:hypothetical protein
MKCIAIFYSTCAFDGGNLINMKQLFTRFLTFPLLSVVLLIACHKSHPAAPAPPYRISATINGVPTTFAAIVTLDSVTTPGTVYIIAHADSANLTPLFELILTSNKALAPGIYPYSQLEDTTAVIQGLIGYTYWSNDSDNQYFSLSDTVTLTTVNKTWIAGTFQGTCQAGYDSVATYITVTNGQFAAGWNQ